MSYARRLGDAINPATLLLGRSERQPQLFLQGSGEDPANGMTLLTEVAPCCRGSKKFRVSAYIVTPVDRLAWVVPRRRSSATPSVNAIAET